ncbi:MULTISPECIES: hypothetical protein [unclassified Streptomyces]|uniref:hypothetical protein n=1 Tax=unclassified Streptomyces TaxID=2593676 RepID=UPI001489EC11|nr:MULTISPECIES: hypothetical protein [unclassified Streptomyces]
MGDGVAVRETAGPSSVMQKAFDLLDVFRIGRVLTIHLCVLRGPEVVYVEKLYTPRARLFATEVGMALPAPILRTVKAAGPPPSAARTGATRRARTRNLPAG